MSSVANPSWQQWLTDNSFGPPQNGPITMEDLEEMLQTSQIVFSDAETQYADEVLNEMKKLISKAKKAAHSLHQLANKLDEVWKNCKTAHAFGTSFEILGGFLTVGGGVATFLTAGAATPLLILGMAVGGAGVTTNITAGRLEAYITSTEVRRVQEELNTTIEYINNVNSTFQRLRDGKEVGRLLCIIHRALYTIKKSSPIIRLLQKLLSKSFFELLTSFKDWGAGMMGATFAGKAAAGAADDVVAAAVKTGTQTADDVVGAGVKASANASKIAGGLIIGVSAAFLVWDTIDLCFTIKDLIDKKGSEAAKDLREKASLIEKHCSFVD